MGVAGVTGGWSGLRVGSLIVCLSFDVAWALRKVYTERDPLIKRNVFRLQGRRKSE